MFAVEATTILDLTWLHPRVAADMVDCDRDVSTDRFLPLLGLRFGELSPAPT
ncbi:hypothetical protein ACGFI9_35345 [Micromonospora sp. NPDC048930]|uniref:hypothetical protein n=1 Tax=Micromonospora sp. NPDC048930 TaxID=3364261 RepID=UPI0037131025